jgi:cell division protein ZapA
MPNVVITVGGRQFEVACQDGEESFLEAAARVLDDEAKLLTDQVGRLTESRMLLMVGLMLADKTVALEEAASDAKKTIRRC